MLILDGSVFFVKTATPHREFSIGRHPEDGNQAMADADQRDEDQTEVSDEEMRLRAEIERLNSKLTELLDEKRRDQAYAESIATVSKIQVKQMRILAICTVTLLGALIYGIGTGRIEIPFLYPR